MFGGKNAVDVSLKILEPMKTPFLLWSAAFGLLAVVLGAFGAHALEARLSAEQQATWETAVHYQFFHALALMGVALLAERHGNRALTWAGWCFVAGILCFSGSLYLLSWGLQGWSGVLGPITPIGGLLFIAGWAVLFAAAWRR